MQSPVRTGSSAWTVDGSPSTPGSSMLTDTLPPLSLASSPGAAPFGFGHRQMALVRVVAVVGTLKLKSTFATSV